MTASICGVETMCINAHVIILKAVNSFMVLINDKLWVKYAYSLHSYCCLSVVYDRRCSWISLATMAVAII